MGIGGIGIWQLLIILVIVLMLFGTKRLRGLGGDLGGAIKGFKKAVSEEPTEKVEDKSAEDAQTAEKVIEGDAEKVDKK
ncbi:MAG: twin-arginine translocase TatA/TatE family subunit [Cellvibrionaceae bacterium]